MLGHSGLVRRAKRADDGVGAQTCSINARPLSESRRPFATRGALTTLSVTAAALVCALALPAGAFASLPDHRIYEQVSPANKNGNAVFPENLFGESQAGFLAAADGNAMMYSTSGAVGNKSVQGSIQQVVARRTPGVGWNSEPAEPRQKGSLGLFTAPGITSVYPSQDLSRIVFDSHSRGRYLAEAYSSEEPSSGTDLKLYASENPFVEPLWLGKPMIENPTPALGGETMPTWAVAGTNPEATTVYFSYSGTLLAEDEPRAEHVADGAWGFYESSNGTLKEAGVLPNGKLSAYGALPAAVAGRRGEEREETEQSNTEIRKSQVSEEGTRALFVSPLEELSEVTNQSGLDIYGTTVQSCPRMQSEQESKEKRENEEFGTPEPKVVVCTGQAPELYMHETLPNGEHKSILVSRDELLEDEYKQWESEGKNPVQEENARLKEEGKVEDATSEYPVGAPSGPVPELGLGSYAYASPDGSRVFFASNDRLTKNTPGIPSRWSLYVSNYTGGNFKLSVTADGSIQTTAPIKYEASAEQVQAALEALSNVGAGKVEVVHPYSPFYTVSFIGLSIVAFEISKSELLPNPNAGGAETGRVGTPPFMYEYERASEKVIYLPFLGASYAASSSNGSRVLLTEESGNLDLLTAGPNGPELETVVKGIGSGVTPARASTDGSVFLFDAYPASTLLRQFNNGADSSSGGRFEFYRLETAAVPALKKIEAELEQGGLTQTKAAELDEQLEKGMACVSCPPRPIVPSGGVEIQTDKALGTSKTIRYMSADGSRVFFQTPDQLVGGDVNGEPNVYEWEDGRDYLISGGNSHVPSRYLDSSESGGDVFFATEQGLVPSDNDEMNDVYDARIPRPGDNPPPEKTPCSGAVCQGPPSVPELLTPAASATFEGLGNIPAAVVAPEKETKPAVKCKKGYVKRSGRCVKRKKKKRKANAKKGRRARKSAAGERRAK